MIKGMKQKAAALLFICVMAVLLPWYAMTAYAATGRIAFSDPSAAVGSEFTVKMKVTGSEALSTADIMLSYDSASLEFVSGTDADGGNGAVRVHGDAGANGQTTLSYELTFKALTAGTSQITVKDREVYDSNSKLVTIDQQGQSKVTVAAAAGTSKDASLKSLQVSPGTLSPEFSADVDTYAVTVGTDVDKLVVSAEPADSSAATSVSGDEGLQMGENRVTVKVTAQDGETTKEYTIVVTKEEGGASADSTTPAEQKSFEMNVSKRTFTVMEPDDTVEVPEGLVPTTITIDGNKVTGWVAEGDTDPQYCVIYAMNESGEKGLYRYDVKSSERTIQRYFTDSGSQAVSADVYNQLAAQYDSLRKDYNLFRTLLIAVIVIALILVVLLILSAAGKKDRRTKERVSGRKKPAEKRDKEDEKADEVWETEEAGEEPEDMTDFKEETEEPAYSGETFDSYEEENGESAQEQEPEEEPELTFVDFSEDEDENVVYTEPAFPEPEEETVHKSRQKEQESSSKNNSDDFEIFDL